MRNRTNSDEKTELIHLDANMKYEYAEYESIWLKCYNEQSMLKKQKLSGFNEVQSKSPGNCLTLLKIRDICFEKSAKVTHLVADLILFLPDAQADGNALQLTAEKEKSE